MKILRTKLNVGSVTMIMLIQWYEKDHCFITRNIEVLRIEILMSILH